MKRNQSGFTLIEIAIVLVIIGLLLGGVLKGQELINSAKVKNLATDFKNIPVYIYGYQDKFRALPGDDAGVQTHLGTTATACTPAAANKCAVGNGLIDGTWKVAAADGLANESFLFWQHVRLAGLAAGPTSTSDNAYIPTNAIGGPIGVTNAAQTPITGLKGTYIVCSDSIPGKFARQLDTQMDDGNTAGGTIQVVAAGTTTATNAVTLTPANDDTPYLVCMGM